MATPINIETGKKYKLCLEKCSYNFKYPNTHLKITNNDNILKMSFLDPIDNKLTNVTYNNASYTVSEIILRWPSLYNFNGTKTDGELTVSHVSTTGKFLLVCVPIKKSNYSSSQALSNILDESRGLANKPDAFFNYQNDDFSLQDLIPEKPFYNYSEGNVDFIVFDPLNAITIESTQFTNIFQKIIKKSSGSFLMPKSIYYNSKGPNLEKLNDGIYISCNPTGQSNDLVDISKPKNNVYFSSNDNVTMFFKIIIGIFLMIFVFSCISALFNYFSPKKIIKNATNAVTNAVAVATTIPTTTGVRV
jgi:carbonic anhydrase